MLTFILVKPNNVLILFFNPDGIQTWDTQNGESVVLNTHLHNSDTIFPVLFMLFIEK